MNEQEDEGVSLSQSRFTTYARAAPRAGRTHVARLKLLLEPALLVGGRSAVRLELLDVLEVRELGLEALGTDAERLGESSRVSRETHRVLNERNRDGEDQYRLHGG